MYHVVYLFMFFFDRNEKSLLNFVSERIKLVYRINNTRYNFQKNQASFQTSKTTIYRPHTFELKSISKYQLFFIGRALKIYDLDTLPWSRWNRSHKYVTTRCTVRDSRRIRSETSSSSIHTKISTLRQLHHCTQLLNHEDI